MTHTIEEGGSNYWVVALHIDYMIRCTVVFLLSLHINDKMHPPPCIMKQTKTSIPPSCSGNRRPQTKRTFYTLDESWSHGIIILRYTMISNQYVELVNSINIMSHTQNTLLTASDNVISIKTEKYDQMVIELLLTVKNGYYQSL